MTNDGAVPDREMLVAELRASGEEFLAKLGALPEAVFDEGRYENGWNGREILAHVAAIEWTYPRLLEIPAQPATSTGDPPTRAAQGGIDAYNARQVEKRAGRSVAELLDEFRLNRETTIASVAAADPALFLAPIRSAGGVSGPLGEVIRNVAIRHIQGHGDDIAGLSLP